MPAGVKGRRASAKGGAKSLAMPSSKRFSEASAQAMARSISANQSAQSKKRAAKIARIATQPGANVARIAGATRLIDPASGTGYALNARELKTVRSLQQAKPAGRQRGHALKKVSTGTTGKVLGTTGSKSFLGAIGRFALKRVLAPATVLFAGAQGAKSDGAKGAAKEGAIAIADIPTFGGASAVRHLANRQRTNPKILAGRAELRAKKKAELAAKPIEQMSEGELAARERMNKRSSTESVVGAVAGTSMAGVGAAKAVGSSAASTRLLGKFAVVAGAALTLRSIAGGGEALVDNQKIRGERKRRSVDPNGGRPRPSPKKAEKPGRGKLTASEKTKFAAASEKKRTKTAAPAEKPKGRKPAKAAGKTSRSGYTRADGTTVQATRKQSAAWEKRKKSK